MPWALPSRTPPAPWEIYQQLSSAGRRCDSARNSPAEQRLGQTANERQGARGDGAWIDLTREGGTGRRPRERRLCLPVNPPTSNAEASSAEG